MAGYVCKHVAAGRVSVPARTSELSTEAQITESEIERETKQLHYYGIVKTEVLTASSRQCATGNPNRPHTLTGGKGDDLSNPGAVCGGGDW